MQKNVYETAYGLNGKPPIKDGMKAVYALILNSSFSIKTNRTRIHKSD